MILLIIFKTKKLLLCISVLYLALEKELIDLNAYIFYSCTVDINTKYRTHLLCLFLCVFFLVFTWKHLVCECVGIRVYDVYMYALNNKIDREKIRNFRNKNKIFILNMIIIIMNIIRTFIVHTNTLIKQFNNQTYYMLAFCVCGL